MSETRRSQKRTEKPGANPDQQGNAVQKLVALPVIREHKGAGEIRRESLYCLMTDKHQSGMYLENCIHVI